MNCQHLAVDFARDPIISLNNPIYIAKCRYIKRGRDISEQKRAGKREARSQTVNHVELELEDMLRYLPTDRHPSMDRDLSVRLPKLTETQLRILEALVGKTFNNKMTKYKIAKETGIDYPRVHEYIEGRKPRGNRRGFPGLKIFELLRDEKVGTAPAGQPKKAYVLMFGGLVKVLSSRPKLWEKIDEITPKHLEIFPLFAKWEYFIRTGIKGFVVRSLKEYFEGWPHPFLEARFTSHGWNKVEFTIKLHGDKVYSDEWEDFRLEATRRAISFRKPGVSLSPTETEVKAWVESISGDAELSKFILELSGNEVRRISALKDENLLSEDSVMKAVKQKNPNFLIRKKMKKKKLLNYENYLDKRNTLTKELEKNFLRDWYSRVKKEMGP